MEIKKKQQKRKKKWKNLIFLLVLFSILSIAILYLDKQEIISIKDYFPSPIDPVTAQANIRDNLSIVGSTLVYNRNNKAVKIDVGATVNGNNYSLNNYLIWYYKITENGWKFGANVSIPDTPLGGFIANNLEEFIFEVHTENATLGQLRGRIKEGFHYKAGCEIRGTGINKKTVCEYVDFDFKDLVQKLGNRPRTLNRTSPYNVTLRYDVSEINFVRGQVIDLDPTITITQESTANALFLNTTQENNFTHLTATEFQQEDINDENYQDGLHTTLDTGLMNGVIDWWHMDNESTYGENDTFVRDFIGLHNITGNPTPTPNGKIRGALDFDGSQVMDFADLNAFDGLSTVTVCSWVKAANADDGNIGIIGRANNPNRQFALYRVSTEVYRFQIYNDSGSTDTAQSASVFADNNWHQICGWYNGSLVDLYVDGVDADSTDDTTVSGILQSAPSGNGELGDAEALAGGWNGTIDETIMFNRALLPEEIKALYNRGIDNLVGYWDFDILKGTTFYDLTKFNNDATLVGSALHSEGIYRNATDYPGHAASYVNLNIPSTDPANVASNFVWSAWIRPEGAQQANAGRIFSFRSSNKDLALNDSGTLIGRVYIGGNIETTNSQDVVSANTWSHVALVYNGTDLYTFINGVKQTGVAASGAVVTGSWTSFVGANGGFQNGFNGKIDEAMIFNTDLSDTQIVDIYNNKSSRFFPQGTIDFITINNQKAAADNRQNVSIGADSNTFFDSSIDLRVGTITSTDNYSVVALPVTPDLWYRFDNLSSEGENESHVKDYGSRQKNLTSVFVGSNDPLSIPNSNKYFGAKFFDGTNDGFTPGSEDFIGNMTILIWYNWTTGINEPLISKSDGTITNGEWNFFMEATGDKIGFNCGGTEDASDTIITLNQWNHMGMSFNEATNEIRWFLNGELDGTDTNSDGCLNTDQTNVDIRVGLSGGMTDLDGAIDELMVFERILTDAEIKQIYLHGGFDYGFTDYQEVNSTNTTAIFTISTDANYSRIEARFNAGNSTSNPFLSSNLVGDITTVTWEFDAAPPVDSCNYTGGNWEITCSDDCDITENITIDGSNITMTGTGIFSIQNGIHVTNWTYRKADATCFYQAFGNGGFYQFVVSLLVIFIFIKGTRIEEKQSESFK